MFLLAGFLPELHFGRIDPEPTGRPQARRELLFTVLHGGE
jgi:hypothetical protein